MNKKVHICYNTAKKIFLELLEDNDFSKDEDIIKILRTIIQKEKASDIRTTELSKIIIDKHCKIFLPNFCSSEIKMQYLPKTVFLFYILHPEGIEFQNLCNHTQELYDIYQVVSSDKNMEANKMKNSIKNLVDLSTNRIYEDCSIIGKALAKVVVAELLEQYRIITIQPKRRLIQIDRKFVSIENDKLKELQLKIIINKKSKQ